jgi:splicing suppressor protein 51
MESGDWSSLHRTVGKQDIIDHYGDRDMPMQMRMLYEKITGRGPMGHNGEHMLRMQMSAETGERTTLHLGDEVPADSSCLLS